jgi:hypothetical protein
MNSFESIDLGLISLYGTLNKANGIFVHKGNTCGSGLDCLYIGKGLKRFKMADAGTTPSVATSNLRPEQKM